MALERELAHYDKHVSEWKAGHTGQFVVVKDENVLGFYSSEDEALTAGATAWGLTSFLVRRVGDEIEEVRVPALTLGLLRADP